MWCIDSRTTINRGNLTTVVEKRTEQVLLSLSQLQSLTNPNDPELTGHPISNHHSRSSAIRKLAQESQIRLELQQQLFSQYFQTLSSSTHHFFCLFYNHFNYRTNTAENSKPPNNHFTYMDNIHSTANRLPSVGGWRCMVAVGSAHRPRCGNCG